MALLGAITRLSDSGLSIMEWAPLNFLPPLHDAEWERLFKLYQKTGEYQAQAHGFGLSDFKNIFWWEWIHRQWGRFMGLYFAGGISWLFFRGHLRGALLIHSLICLILGGSQALIGWFMVYSGFSSALTDVSAIRLALHLFLALSLILYLLYLAYICSPKALILSFNLPYSWAWTLFILTIITIFSGVLVAGLNAGMIYNDYPRMGLGFIPSDYWAFDGFWSNALQSPAASQFHHRILTAVLALTTLSLGIKYKLKILSFFILLQFGLGLITLLLQVPIWAAVLHQLGAVLLLGTSFLYILAIQGSMRNFLRSSEITQDLALDILNQASYFHQKLSEGHQFQDLQGKIGSLMFLEASTRTLFSFQSAIYRLGGQALVLDQAGASSLAKGESLVDTFRMMESYADFAVVRHADPAWIEDAHQYFRKPLVNAGSGGEEHPTQALIDLLTIQHLCGRLDHLKILFAFDPLHSRSIKSLTCLLKLFPHNSLDYISPCPVPDLPGQYFSSLKDIDDALMMSYDVIYLNRLQRERHAPHLKLTSACFEVQDLMRSRAYILNPLPRVDEMDPDLDLYPDRAQYFFQSSLAVPVRMAILKKIMKASV